MTRRFRISSGIPSILPSRRWAMVLAGVLLGGCERPLPPPRPSPEQWESMQALQDEERRRELDVETRIDQIRQRRPIPQAQLPLIPNRSDWTTEDTVIDSLGRIGQPTVTPLTQELIAADPRRRRRAAEILGRIGPEAADAVPALTACLSDPDKEVRKAAAHALGQIGPAAAEAVPKLLRLLDPDGNRNE